MLWAALPLRGFATGKTRLAAVLDDAARADLNRHLFAQTLAAAVDVLGQSHVLVVSPDQAVIAAAGQARVPAVLEAPTLGLNGALTLARRVARGQGASGLLSIHCDLPLLAPADLAAMIGLWSGPDGAVLASDQTRTGTNALLVDIDAPFTYAMGPDSAARHRLALRAVGVTPVEIDRDGLRFDLDLPDDLIRWRDRPQRAA